MQVATKPRTWQQVQDHPAVSDVEVWPNEESKYWIYLKTGYDAASDPGAGLHQGNGATIREAIEDVFPVGVCRCEDCEHERQRREGVPE